MGGMLEGFSKRVKKPQNFGVWVERNPRTGQAKIPEVFGMRKRRLRMLFRLKMVTLWNIQSRKDDQDGGKTLKILRNCG